MAKSYERKNFFGNEYLEHEDGTRSYAREDLFGNRYWEHEDGTKSYEREDLFGNKYEEHQGGSRSYEREDTVGNTYKEHQDGSRSYLRTDLFGNEYWDDEREVHTEELLRGNVDSGAPQAVTSSGGSGTVDRVIASVGNDLRDVLLFVALLGGSLLSLYIGHWLTGNTTSFSTAWWLGVVLFLLGIPGFLCALWMAIWVSLASIFT